MTIQHIHTTEDGPIDGEVEDLDLVTTMLRNNMNRERRQADQFAEEASRYRANAAALEEKAMDCRERERRYQRLLHLDAAGDELVGELINDDGDAQTTLIPRQRRMYPLIHREEWGDTPHLACVNCGQPLREATAAEVEAIAGGREVSHACDDCRGKQGGNPYPTPPQDAA